MILFQKHLYFKTKWTITLKPSEFAIKTHQQHIRFSSMHGTNQNSTKDVALSKSIEDRMGVHRTASGTPIYLPRPPGNIRTTSSPRPLSGRWSRRGDGLPRRPCDTRGAPGWVVRPASAALSRLYAENGDDDGWFNGAEDVSVGREHSWEVRPGSVHIWREYGTWCWEGACEDDVVDFHRDRSIRMSFRLVDGIRTWWSNPHRRGPRGFSSK